MCAALEVNLVDVFDRLGKETASEPAVAGGHSDGDTCCLSWGELRQISITIAARIAAELADVGGAPVGNDSLEQVVAVLARRSPMWLAATVGIMRCGSPFVWMGAGELGLKSRRVEAERNTAILRTLAPPLVLLGGDVADEVMPDWTLCEARPRFLQLAACAGKGDSTPVAAQIPRQVCMGQREGSQPRMCYMLTGGTTGASKCVQVTHAMAVHEVNAYPGVAPSLSKQDRVLQHTPVLWAASALGQIDIALAFGATICISSAMDQDAIVALGATVLGTVPSSLEALEPGSVPRVRCVFTWGEAMSRVLAERWRRAGVTVLELLISTEYWLSFFSMGATSSAGHTLYSVVKGADVAVLSEGEVFPKRDPGALGELCLRGPMVSHGYLQKSSDESSASGADDSKPFVDASDGGQPYFRSRDLVRLLPEACGMQQLEFCGRSDQLIKVAGQFVDLSAAERELRMALSPWQPGRGRAGDSDLSSIQNVAVAGEMEAAIVPARGDAAPGSAAPAHAFVTAPAGRQELGPGEITTLLACARTAVPRGAALHFVRGPLPRDAVTGKVDRRTLLACVEGMPPSLSAWPGLKSRMRKFPRWWLLAVLSGGLDVPALLNVLLARGPPEIPSAAWWLQVLLHVGSLPYLWLLSMHLPRVWQRRVTNYFPFGRLGLLCALRQVARRAHGQGPRRGVHFKLARMVLLTSTVTGMVLAGLRRRLLQWWLAFWLAVPDSIDAECGWWFKSQAWHWYADQVALTIQDLPDSLACLGDWSFWLLEQLPRLPQHCHSVLQRFSALRMPYELPEALRDKPGNSVSLHTDAGHVSDPSIFGLGSAEQPEANMAATTASDNAKLAGDVSFPAEWDLIWEKCAIAIDEHELAAESDSAVRAEASAQSLGSTADSPTKVEGFLSVESVHSMSLAADAPIDVACPDSAESTSLAADSPTDVARFMTAESIEPAAVEVLDTTGDDVMPLVSVASSLGETAEYFAPATPQRNAATGDTSGDCSLCDGTGPALEATLTPTAVRTPPVLEASPEAEVRFAESAMQERCCSQCSEPLLHDWRSNVNGELLCRRCFKELDNQWWYSHTRDIIDEPHNVTAAFEDATKPLQASVGSSSSSSAALPRASEAASSTVRAASASGARLLQLLEHHLGTRELTANTSLAGIDSIAVLSLCRALRAASSLNGVPTLAVRPQEVFKCSSVGELLALVEALAASAKEASTAGSVTVGSCRSAGWRETAVWFNPGQYTGTCKWLYGCQGLMDEGCFRTAAARLVARHEALHADLCDGQAVGIDLVKFFRDTLAVQAAIWPEVDLALSRVPRQMRSTARAFMTGIRRFVSWSLEGSWPRVAPLPITQQFLDARVQVYRCLSWAEVDDAVHRHRETFTPPFVMALFLLEDPFARGTHAARAQRDCRSLPPHEWGAPSSFISFVVSHAYSDGYSSVPLVHDFGALYEHALAEADAIARGSSCPARAELTPLHQGAAFKCLEERFFAALHCRSKWSHPDQLSFRGSCFDAPYASKWSPWVYNHEMLLETGGVELLRRCSQRYGMPFDVVLLSLVLAAIFRASAPYAGKSSSLHLTLYAPMRDGDLNEAMVGLFSDFRDITVPCGALATVLGLCLDVADAIRHRRWSVFDAIQNSERILVNILPLDEQARGTQQFRQTRAHEYRGRRVSTPGERRSYKANHRPMRITLEQESMDAWWLSLDINSDFYPPSWCRRFAHDFKRCLEDLALQPLARVLPGEQAVKEKQGMSSTQAMAHARE